MDGFPREFVAVLIGDNRTGVITTQWSDVRVALGTDAPLLPISRQMMQMMAAMDLGPRWKELAEAPTMFLQDENNEYRMP